MNERGPSGDSVASLAATVLDEEAARQAAQEKAREQIIFPDDLLPGVNATPMTLREGLRVGGWLMFIVLTCIVSLDELEGAAIYVLAPEIRDTFHISEGAIVFIGTASAAFFVLGAVPMGWLADRYKRVPIVGWTAMAFGVFVLMSGFAVNAFMLFWTRFATGITKASTITVHNSLVADAYPINVRARMSASMQGGAHLIGLISPVLVAGIAGWAGGAEGWRWAWYALGIPVSIVAIGAFFMHEPPRGQFEKSHVLGEVIEEQEPAPISMEAAFARLKKIKTIRTVLIAFCALGFGLFSQGTLASLYLDDNLHIKNAFDRGLVLSLSGIAALPILPFVAKYFDRTYRQNPAKALAIVGALIAPSSIFTPLQFSVHSRAWFVLLGIPQSVLITSAFAMVGPVLYAVVPYRLRGMGSSLTTMYIFFIGGFLGGIIAAFFTDAIGTRGTVIVLGVPTSIIGGLMLMNGARFIRNDLSLVVSELLEEQEEHHKRAEGGLAPPVLQIADIDFSYGPVQVLFDVDLEVARGETLALLGTNGAGKSTILRVVSGLGVPERGVVRLNGQNVTYVMPEMRAKMGIVQLPGGKGVFPNLTVGQNLAVSARLHTSSRSEIDEKTDRIYEMFPELATLRKQLAGSLSGGQNQMLALGRVLLHEPEILLIDELSLGLAPVVVQRLLAIIEELKDRGQTMLIVEQSLNVALSIADRAIFLEKGQVRFEGAARDLLERDDLVRAVFFGHEGRVMLASLFTWNLLVIGSVKGLIISLIAMGIVLIYRSTRVINFAVGDLGVPSAGLLGVMAGAHGWPYWLALPAALVIGALAGALVELSVIRRLFTAPRVIVLVATIGVAQLAQAVTLTLPEYRTGSLSSTYPLPFKSQWHLPGDITLNPGQIMALLVVPLVTVGLWWLLGHTAFGEAVRASVGNPDLARLTGINPKMVSTAVWAIGGFLSALAIVLLATESTASDLVSIGPNTLLLGLTAALVGRMVSFPKAVVASIVIGVINQVLFFNYADQPGLVQFILFLAVIALVARRSRTVDMGTESFQFAPRHHVVSERLREIWWVKRMPQFVAVVGLAVAIVLPQFINESAKHLTYAEVLAFALCAVSVTVLTGWAGQLSLGQMAFAGVGALSAAALVRGVEFTFGLWGFNLVSVSVPQVPYGWSMLLGAVIACVTATLIGLTALRVRGLLLAASTLAFAITAQLYIFRQPVLSLGRQTVRLPREDLGPYDLTHRNLGYYYFSLTALVIVLVVVGHLRRSGIGRTIIGVRENEPAAEAFTVSPTRAKLTAYALGGFVAGLGGAILGGLAVTIGFTERFYRVQDSFALVSMAVIGGLGSTAGAVLGAVWVIGLPAFWPNNEVVPLFTSSIGLLLILLYIPGGFTQISYWIRDQLFSRIERRLGPVPPKASVEPPLSLRLAVVGTAAQANADGSALSTHGLTVNFGGLVAVNHVDFRAMPGQVVGLIGSNGAGKSTLLNAIGGFVPSTGNVHLLGTDVSHKSAHKRAARGLGRTFQAALLFPELTVREVVQLALEARQHTSFWSTALFLPSATRLERRRHAEASELIDFLGLGRYADRFVAELSTGTRRIVELAALLAVAPRVICLDEPTAGVAQREAEAFGPLIKRLQSELSATLVVVEHDLPLILAITDHVYCLEAGSVIADGAPHEIRTNPLVVSSYLGTDERATMRSNAALTD